jgi:tRNA pseudouridine55 synthase
VARRKPAKVHGALLVDKPAGMTSHDVVGQLRRRLGERRIGHAGTLDPDATGLLVIGVGQATRLLRFATASTKTYEADVVFGTETSTLDAAGEVTATHDMSGLTPTQVTAAALGLTGVIEQIPPMVSAIKIDGKRLHELAREGIEVERAPRPVTIHRLDVTELPPDEATGAPVYRAIVECSAGTYIRTLGADLGTALGGGAHIRNLRRSASGAFRVDEPVAGSIDEAPLLPVIDMLRGMDQLIVDDAQVERIGHGASISDELAVGEGPWAILDEDGVLLAVHERVDGRVKVGVVLPALER